MSRYPARDSTGRVCADIEPMGVSPSGECAKDRSLDSYSRRMLNGLTRDQYLYGTDQKRTDLSELPDTSS